MRRQRTLLWLALIGWLGVCQLSAPAGAEEQNPVKFARFQIDKKPAYGIVEGDCIREIKGTPFGAWQKTDATHALADVKLLVPSRPSKVIAIAGNYTSHLGKDHPVPKHPEAFFKVPSCLVPDGAKVVIPKGTEYVHFEAELVIVIGKLAKNVPASKALDYVLGVTCGNDISARDWQKNDVQWWRAKGSDTFGPCGPFVASGIDYGNLELQLRVNGKVKQKAHTSDMIHSVPALVSFLSAHVTLQPGDLIFTGTPGKTSSLQPGDTVEVELQGVGVLKNKVVAAK